MAVHVKSDKSAKQASLTLGPPLNGLRPRRTAGGTAGECPPGDDREQHPPVIHYDRDSIIYSLTIL